jgi:conjugative relaxase-like TrwC/TraI family protein
MFTMAKIRIGVTYLDTHLVENDYYTAKEEKVVGTWAGKAAERMGIEGNTIHAGDISFQRIRDNQHPITGEKLTPRTNKFREPSYVEAHKELTDKWRYEGNNREPSSYEVEAYRLTMNRKSNRISFFDFQCGSPKSVSVMALVAGDERLRSAHSESVRVALSELERFAAYQTQEKIGRTRKREISGEICAALFEHDSSRALDPQLHVHCVVANATWDKERQRWVALTEFEMVHAIRYAMKVYANDLGSRIKTLGYKLADEYDAEGNIIGWQIAGVPREVCELFSQRRKEIELGIEKFKDELGRAPTRAEISVITRNTRDKKFDKSNPQTAAKVRAKQLARLKPEEVSLLNELAASARPIAPSGDDNSTPALEAAIAHGFERASVRKGHAILADALNASLGSVDLERLKHALAEEETGLQFLANETPNELLAEFATKGGVKTEEWSVEFVDRTNGKFAPIAGKASVENSGLDEEQTQAVEFVCRSKNQVIAIRGVAGAGKTTTLKALDRALDAAGREMLYLAPTASAVSTLKREGFEKATTVADYLARSGRNPLPGAVIIIDEAGLQSNRQGAEVLALAEKYRQRIVFVGDSRQHVSVEAGDFLRILETHSKIDTRELKNIRRQSVEDYRQAVAAMAGGETAAGMEQLDAMGWLREGKSAYLEQAAEAWVERSNFGAEGSEVLCVSPTWEENFALSDAIRDRLRGAGKLNDAVEVDSVHSLKWTTAKKRKLADVVATTPGLLVTPVNHLSGLEQSRFYEIESVVEGRFLKLAGGHLLDAKKDASRFDVGVLRRLQVAKGEQLLIRMNDRDRELINGQIVKVADVRADGSIRTECGKEIPATFGQFTYGYVVTSQKAQGRTSKHVILAAERLDGKSAYVGCSRGRESCEVFTPDKERLFDGLPFNGDRRAALDVMKEQREVIRTRLSRPPSIVTRIKKAVIRRVSQLGKRLRTQTELARRANMLAEAALPPPTKQKML